MYFMCLKIIFHEGEMALRLLVSKVLKGRDEWCSLSYLLELNLVFPALLCCA